MRRRSGPSRIRVFDLDGHPQGGVPLQPVASGRYRDRFERVDGEWRFTYRDYSMLEFVGNISRHVRRYGNQV